MQKNQPVQEQPSKFPQHVQYKEQKYRWVIVALTAFSMVVNGLANNCVIPIAHKISLTYQLSTGYANAPILAIFLVYSLANFPANYIIDKKGLKVSFRLGTGFYLLGLFMVALIDKGYYFVLFGSICIGIGQPFILNCPAKVAACWFFGKNRPLATGIMTAFLLVGTGFGFFLPTIMVKEDSTGEEAKTSIFYLYVIQCFIAAFCFILIMIFMKQKPSSPPSRSAAQQKVSLKQTLQLLKKDKNLWIFITAYVITYGTLVTFGAQANFLFKPYGFGDIQIAIFATVLLLAGVFGSIMVSVYIKKTSNYRLCIRVIPVLAFIFIVITCIVVNTIPYIGIVVVCIICFGFCFTPLIPVCYDLGCQLSYPIGEAMLIGFLNGGSFLYTFLFGLIVSNAIGFQNKTDSLIVMSLYSVFILIGAILFYFVKIRLKRRQLEKEGHIIDIQMQGKRQVDESTDQSQFRQPNQQKIQNVQLLDRDNYTHFVQEAIEGAAHI